LLEFTGNTKCTPNVVDVCDSFIWFTSWLKIAKKGWPFLNVHKAF